MRTPRALRWCSAVWLIAGWLMAVWIPAAAGTAGELGLADAAREALTANLDLAAQRRALAADHEDIGLARADLLPQIDIGGRAEYVEVDINDRDRQTESERSLSAGAQLRQALYDESDWADLGIQKHIYSGQEARFEAFRLTVVRDAANAFLELDRARALLDIEEHNRSLTASNLETSQARIAAGWSSQREVLRWESQLASNDSDIAEARKQVFVNRFELNRVRNRPAEDAITPQPASVEEYGFAYARQRIVTAIAKPEGDRRLRDLMVRIGLPRSPDLMAIDAAIAAQERLYTSNKRAFWIPSFDMDASVDHSTTKDNGRGLAGSSSYNETEVIVGAQVTFPLFEGGAKFAQLRQAREDLSSFRFQRRALAQSIDQAIRAAFAQASGSYAQIDFARQQRAAAQRNYELVGESYVLGVASILSLLDAQSQLLTADQAVANALYGFLEDLVDAEQQMSFYAFLESESEQLLDRVEMELESRP